LFPRQVLSKWGEKVLLEERVKREKKAAKKEGFLGEAMRNTSSIFLRREKA